MGGAGAFAQLALGKEGGLRNSGGHGARSLGCFWGAVCESANSADAAAPPGPHPRPLGHLCIPRSSLFPGPGCYRPSIKLWRGVRGAGVFTWLRLGSGEAVAAGADLFPPCLEASQHRCSLTSGVQASPVFLSVPAVLQAVKVAFLLYVGPQDWDTQSVLDPLIPQEECLPV